MVLKIIKLFSKGMHFKKQNKPEDDVKFEKPDVVSFEKKDQPENNDVVSNDVEKVNLEKEKTEEKETGWRSMKWTFVAAFAASLFTLCNALNWAWLSIVIMKLQEPDAPFKITDEQTAYLHHASQVTSLLGTFIIIPMTNIWGRKKSLLVGIIPYCIMSVVYYFGNSFQSLFIARGIAGFAGGAIGTIVHVYLTEISPAENRGKISSMSAIQGSFGHLLGIIVIPLMTIQQSAIMLFIYPFIAMPFFLYFSPETPYFYVLRNKPDKALKSIQKLHQDETILDRMLEDKDENKKAKLTDLVTNKGNRKALGYAAILHVTSAFTGVGPISYYCTLIFRRESTFSWHYAMIILNVTGLLTNFVSGDLADRFGRRPLLLCSCLTTSSMLILLGSYFFFKNTLTISPELAQILQFTPLVGIFFFQITLHLGIAQVNRLASSELFPTHLRTSSSATRKVFGTALSIVVLQTYQRLSSNLGLWWAFWFFGSITIVNGFVAFSLFPETKGKTFEEIQAIIHKDD